MPINNKAYDLYDLHEEALSSEILEEIKIQFRCLTFTCQEFVVNLYDLLLQLLSLLACLISDYKI